MRAHWPPPPRHERSLGSYAGYPKPRGSSNRVSPAVHATGKRAVVGVLSRVLALVLGRDRTPPPVDSADNCSGASALVRVATDRTDGSAERGPAQAAIIVCVGHPRRAVVGVSLRTAT